MMEEKILEPLKNTTRYCILGATGYIGSYLYDRMKDDGLDVIGSSRVPQTSYFKFNVQDGDYCPQEFLEDKRKKIVIICFAEAKIDQCRLDYDNAYEINVSGTLKLIHKLSNDRCKVIVFSSDNVFGDNKGNYTEQDDLSPVNQYGAMKAELERRIQQDYPETLVLRLPKVVGTEMSKSNLLVDYLSKMQQGETIYAIKDSRMSVVSLEDLYQTIIRACELNLSGLYQVCSDKSYSRAELASIFSSKIGIKVEIIEKEIEEFGFRDIRPKRINMVNDKITNEMRYCFQDYESIVEDFIKKNGNEISTIISQRKGIIG